jgi:hypothetical protein
MGMAAGAALVVGEVAVVRLPWPDFQTTSLMSVLLAGAYIGGFSAAVLVFDRRPLVLAA